LRERLSFGAHSPAKKRPPWKRWSFFTPYTPAVRSYGWQKAWGIASYAAYAALAKSYLAEPTPQELMNYAFYIRKSRKGE
jgi:hypothetical protein